MVWFQDSFCHSAFRWTIKVIYAFLIVFEAISLCLYWGIYYGYKTILFFPGLSDFKLPTLYLHSSVLSIWLNRVYQCSHWDLIDPNLAQLKIWILSMKVVVILSLTRVSTLKWTCLAAVNWQFLLSLPPLPLNWVALGYSLYSIFHRCRECSLLH